LVIKGPAVQKDKESYVIITEFNCTIQGFMVQSVERIVNLKWEDIRLPPEGANADSYINSVTNINGEMVQLIDVEQVLTEVVGEPEMVSSSVVESLNIEEGQLRHNTGCR